MSLIMPASTPISLGRLETTLGGDRLGRDRWPGLGCDRLGRDRWPGFGRDRWPGLGCDRWPGLEKSSLQKFP